MYYEALVYNIDTKEWSHRVFETKKVYRDYIDSYFKYPGEYNLKYSNGYWNDQAIFFEANDAYPKFVPNSLDFRKHWNFEKEKCTFEGVIIYIKPSENYEQPVPSLYYWYLNYIYIYDKVKSKYTFAEVWDGDYHYFLFILRCLLHGKFAAILKKRQSGYTLKNTAIMLLAAWFGNGWISKIFANGESHVTDSWKFLESYREHINKHCGWKRGFSPDQPLNWQVRRKKNDGSYVGNFSMLQGISTAKDPSKGVGGSIKVLFGEEAGKNDTLDITHEYVTSNVSLGSIQTGLIVYSGAVGELDKCEPLKKYILNPVENNFMATENVCEGDEKLGADVGFFAPEWWNYKYEDKETAEIKNCYDEWGNTDKDLALKVIMEERELNKNKSPEDYRYYCSQRPLSITEAFAYRKESVFPAKLLDRQLFRIETNKDGKYNYELFDIERDINGKPKLLKTKHLENTDLPFKPQKGLTPYGCIKIWEKPPDKPEWGTYFAAVDPIYVDVTTTSESLFSVVIYKNLCEIKYVENGEEKTRMEGDKIVASYLGRYGDVAKTNEVGELMLEIYNALAVVENNVDNFIKHMISKSKQKYMATKQELPFLKELATNNASYQEYGVRTNATMWNHYINKIIEYIKEETSVEHKADGSVLRTIYGVEKVPDARLIKELLSFDPDKGNYDQIITFGLVLALAKSRQANGLIKKIIESSTDETQKRMKEIYKSDKRNPFSKKQRNPFKYAR